MLKGYVALMALCTLAAWPASAIAGGQAQDDKARTRDQIFNMENTLRVAVHSGAGNLATRLRGLSPAAVDMRVSVETMLVTAPEAYGFRVPAGMFFHVRVPQMNANVMWSLLTPSAGQQVRSFGQSQSQSQGRPRTVGQSVPEGATKGQGQGGEVQDPERRIEGATTSASPVETGGPALTERDVELLTNPRAAYRRAIKEALIGAMLEHGGTLRIAAGEYLTVAARGDAPLNLLDPSDRVHTVTFKVTGETLEAFRQGRLSPEEARRQVVVEED